MANGSKYVANDQTFPDFQDGAKYVLFLEPLRDGTHSFRIFAGEALLLQGDSVSRIDDYQRVSPLSQQLRSSTVASFTDLISKMVLK